MFKVQFKKEHFFFTVGTLQRVISHSGQETIAPGVEIEDGFMFGFMNSSVKIFIDFAVSGIKSIVTGHFEILFRDVLDEQLDKVDGRKCFSDKRIIFMFIVMKSYIITVIGINPGKGNDRTSQITANIADNGFWVAEIRFGINIKAVFILTKDFRLDLFEGGTDTLLEFI